jgi:TorA maturation chaperone TorD
METLKAQANMYEIVKAAFYPPDADLAAAIADGSFGGRIQGIVDQCCSLTAKCCLPSDLMKEVHGLSRSMDEEGDLEKFMEALHVEYTWLFVNAFPNLWTPPYESYYREGRMMGRAAVDCLSTYKEDGLVLTEDGDLPDHIVTQLEYLHFLCLAEMEAAEQVNNEYRQTLREKKRKFYEQHIIHWVPEFCGKVRSHSRIEFYRVMSRLLKNFILLENRGLNAEKLDLFEEVGHNEVKRA